MTLWVFGYGSLMWNPGFDYEEQFIARLPGYHRSFCMRSIHHRGTDENPGLVLALDETDEAQCAGRSEEHTSELQSLTNLVCRLLLEKKKQKKQQKDSEREGV